MDGVEWLRPDRSASSVCQWWPLPGRSGGHSARAFALAGLLWCAAWAAPLVSRADAEPDEQASVNADEMTDGEGGSAIATDQDDLTPPRATTTTPRTKPPQPRRIAPPVPIEGDLLPGEPAGIAPLEEQSADAETSPQAAPRFVFPSADRPAPAEADEEAEDISVNVHAEPAEESSDPESPSLAARVRAHRPAAEAQQAATGAEEALAPQATEVGPRSLEAASDEAPSEVAAASLNGIQPGTSTIDDVAANWGTPTEVSARGRRIERVYNLAPFQQVTAAFDDDIVTSIVVDLGEPFAVDLVGRQLGLAKFRPILVRDEAGEVLGQAYPERGVLFNFSVGETDRVTQFILEPVSAELFVHRAESKAVGLEASLADLEQALAIDPAYARAWLLKARLLGRTGQLEESLAAAQQAVRLKPKHEEHRLALAEALHRVGKDKAAIEELSRLIGQAGVDPMIKAQGHLLLGDLAAAGPERDYRTAVREHLQAIKIAEWLAAARRESTRQAARELLVQAHLAIAGDIAWGHWKDKTAIVPQWLDKAAALATSEPRLATEHQFQIAARALGASVGLEGETDPTSWIEKSLRLGRLWIDEAPDQLSRRQRQWEVGLAVYDGLQALHMRGECGLALKYGQQAVAHLEAGAEGREAGPGQAYMVGRLYYRMGVIQAVHNRDHAEAVVWFNKALPLLEQPLEPSALGDTGRQGETFVSMAVSYWQTGQEMEAARMTARGIDLMLHAIQEGLLADDALSVPYGNLSFMYRSLGDDHNAERYAELAAEKQASSRR
jgi:tetratricopeptide (TPR) repeat protein